MDLLVDQGWADEADEGPRCGTGQAQDRLHWQQKDTGWGERQGAHATKGSQLLASTATEPALP